MDGIEPFGLIPQNATDHWTPTNQGRLVMYRGDYRRGEDPFNFPYAYPPGSFKWGSAHEFGHSMGIADANGHENSNNPEFHSIMNAGLTAVQERDIEMLLAAQRTGRWQVWEGLGARLP